MDNRFDAYRAKIFLTGDSITEGDGNASAYRYALFKKLWEAGAAFTFLGPNTSGDLRLPTAYYPHGGYCGITIGSDPEKDPGLMDRVKNMEGYIEAVREADIIVLWIGYNDYGRKIDLDHIGDRLKALIGEYHALNPDVTIFTGTLFDYDNPDRKLNGYILDPATKAALEAEFAGLTYIGVDMNVGENRLTRNGSDFPEDDGHPAEPGNIKIANSWFDAIIGKVRELNEREADTDARPVRAASISGDLRPMTLRPGESVTFRAKAMPEDAEVSTILWESSDASVASADDYGRIRAMAAGETVITAKTLDGGHALTAKVTVAGEAFCAAEGFTQTFAADFTKADGWEGPEDVFSTDFNKLGFRWNRTKTGELTCKEEIACGGDFVLACTMRTANDRTRSAARWLAVRYAGLELRFRADGGEIMLYEGDALRGAWHTMSPAATDDRYAMKRKGTTASLWRNGEFLFAAAVSETAGGSLTIAWNDMTKSDLRDLVIYTKE